MKSKVTAEGMKLLPARFGGLIEKKRKKLLEEEDGKEKKKKDLMLFQEVKESKSWFGC